MLAQTYLNEARGLKEAVAILCGAKCEATLYSIGILAAHCLELGLKAYLLHSGYNEKDLRRIGHNINDAWEKCLQAGVELEELPYWVQVLNYSHSNPFFFRYPQEDHKVAIPSVDDLPRDIDNVLSKITVAMK